MEPKKLVHFNGKLQQTVLYDSVTCGMLWFKNRKMHRNGDKPASTGKYRRVISWHRNGYQHREDNKPAAIFNDGVRIWCSHGIKVKEDKVNPKIVSAYFSYEV